MLSIKKRPYSYAKIGKDIGQHLTKAFTAVQKATYVFESGKSVASTGVPELRRDQIQVSA